jgi:hypothetical protein
VVGAARAAQTVQRFGQLGNFLPQQGDLLLRRVLDPGVYCVSDQVGQVIDFLGVLSCLLARRHRSSSSDFLSSQRRSFDIASMPCLLCTRVARGQRKLFTKRNPPSASLFTYPISSGAK